MNAILKSSLKNISEVCRRFGVKRLSAFGSAARGDEMDEQSDIDLIAEFGASVDGGGLADRYLDFAEEAERLLGRKVDLLTENSIRNPIFRSQIEADRKVLYEASTAQATG
jgi:predicted nucleotidyltransferase